MKITAEGESCIAVELTGDDMNSLNITYDELDYSKFETRRIFRALLDEAEKVAGGHFKLSECMMIETIPADGGGCIILFTPLPDGADKKRKVSEDTKTNSHAEPIVFDFYDADGMIDFYKELPLAELCEKAALYENNGSFRAVITPVPEKRDRLKAAASEFGDILKDASSAESECECLRCISAYRKENRAPSEN